MKSFIIVGAVGVHYTQLVGGKNHFAFPNQMLTVVFKTRVTKLLEKHQTIIGLVGSNTGVELLFGIALTELKSIHGERIRIHAFYPYENYLTNTSPEDRRINETILSVTSNKHNTSNKDTIPIHDKENLTLANTLSIVKTAQQLYVVGYNLPDKVGQTILEENSKGTDVIAITTGVKGVNND